jgi:hypothetical protein
MVCNGCKYFIETKEEYKTIRICKKSNFKNKENCEFRKEQKPTKPKKDKKIPPKNVKPLW